MDPLPPAEATTLSPDLREQVAQIFETAATLIAHHGWRAPGSSATAPGLDLNAALREACYAHDIAPIDPLRGVALVAAARHFAHIGEHVTALTEVENLHLAQQRLTAAAVLAAYPKPGAPGVIAELHAAALAIRPTGAAA